MALPVSGSRPTVYRPSHRPSFRLRILPSPFARRFGMVSASFVTAHNTANGREKLSQNGTVIRKLSFAPGAAPFYLCLWRRNSCAAGGVLFGFSGAVLERPKSPSIDYSCAKYARLALPILRDVITSVSSKNSHKAPLKPLGHLRLRELRRQPLQNVPQKAPQSPALKTPSTAHTAGRSDRAERRFRCQPFILL